MAFLRTNFKSLTTKKKRGHGKKEKKFQTNDRLFQIQEQFGIKNIYRSMSFLVSLEKLSERCDCEENVLKLLKKYAEKISKDLEFDDNTKKYAENLKTFIDKFKFESSEMGACLRAAEALYDPYQWECFCIGALHLLRKEYLYDQRELFLF